MVSDLEFPRFEIVWNICNSTTNEIYTHWKFPGENKSSGLIYNLES